MRDFFFVYTQKEMNIKVAIQGIKGSNHYQVALDNYGEDVHLIACDSFGNLVTEMLLGHADHGIMAIENSIAGSIIPNYNLIYDNHLHIAGEYYLDIHHNLMTLKGQMMSDIREVHSHPMALLQCADFFKKHPKIRLVADVDTAATAKRIQDESLKHIGALAPQIAAKLYDLDIIEKHIESAHNNETRFFIVSKEEVKHDIAQIDKASVRFITDHKRGSLAAILNVMSDCRLNLTKIQSLPVLNSPWKYAFFVDVTFDEYKHFEKAKSLLHIMAQDFKVLGEYKNTKL